MACCRLNAWRLWVIALFSALAASGCANMDFPRIDPTGQRIFLPRTAPPAYAARADIRRPSYPLLRYRARQPWEAPLRNSSPVARLLV